VIIGTPPGGGQVGLLMISPWVAPNTQDIVDTLNHFSVLKGIEQLFKLPNLGYANVPALPGFGVGMFSSTKH
jgi:phosphatidylinositol-3-phosphatase